MIPDWPLSSAPFPVRIQQGPSSRSEGSSGRQYLPGADWIAVAPEWSSRFQTDVSDLEAAMPSLTADLLSSSDWQFDTFHGQLGRGSCGSTRSKDPLLCLSNASANSTPLSSSTPFSIPRDCGPSTTQNQEPSLGFASAPLDVSLLEVQSQFKVSGPAACSFSAVDAISQSWTGNDAQTLFEGFDFNDYFLFNPEWVSSVQAGPHFDNTFSQCNGASLPDHLLPDQMLAAPYVNFQPYQSNDVLLSLPFPAPSSGGVHPHLSDVGPGCTNEYPYLDSLEGETPCPAASTRSTPLRTTHRDNAKDQLLIQCKLKGMSYKQIKEAGQFEEAESTLRGRFRTLTKPKEMRVRKPEWSERDVSPFRGKKKRCRY